ncbi:hypothetical protein C9374_002064 [Naegleria lovaniensis]|uniref:Uncharacterized protein n=1 Tax=Naegleria lovaniensis TaxID=51637 RepID=A0AA88GVQ9_NAELO|nr:uncharacterized protein C9374_002064 [Naegleria lovaniensis]KAG2387029.1 hypothetical protein C9374_002064 [Naegleria lovaniensis]
MKEVSNKNFLRPRRRYMTVVANNSEDEFMEFNDRPVIDLFAPTTSMRESFFVKEQMKLQTKKSIGKSSSIGGTTDRNVLCLGLFILFFFFISICVFIFWLEPIILGRIYRDGSRFLFNLSAPLTPKK